MEFGVKYLAREYLKSQDCPLPVNPIQKIYADLPKNLQVLFTINPDFLEICFKYGFLNLCGP